MTRAGAQGANELPNPTVVPPPAPGATGTDDVPDEEDEEEEEGGANSKGDEDDDDEDEGPEDKAKHVHIHLHNESLTEGKLNDKDLRKYFVPNKSVVIKNVWWTIKSRDLDKDRATLVVSTYAIKDGHKPGKMEIKYSDILKNINSGKWGGSTPDKGHMGHKQDPEARAKVREKHGVRAAPGFGKKEESLTEAINEKAAKEGLEKAHAIHKQIGAKAHFMLGAKNMMVDHGQGYTTKGEDGKETHVPGTGMPSYQFKIGKNAKNVNHIKVHLKPDDTYKVDFGKISGGKYTVKHSADGVYADDLHRTIEHHTGMKTSLGTMGKK